VRWILISLVIAVAQAAKPVAATPAEKEATAKLAAFEKAFKPIKDDASLEPRKAALAALEGQDDARAAKAAMAALQQLTKEYLVAQKEFETQTDKWQELDAKLRESGKPPRSEEKARLEKLTAAAGAAAERLKGLYGLGESLQSLVAAMASREAVVWLLENGPAEKFLGRTTLGAIAQHAAALEPPLVDALVGALGSAEAPESRVALVEGIAACGRAAAGQAKLLADLLWSKDEEVRVAALWALGACGSPDAIAPLVHRLGEEKSLLEMRRDSLALRWLTDADHGWEVRAWRTWLAADGAKLADGSAPLPERTRVECFGLPLYAQSYAFVVDCSEAMLAKWPKADSAETRLDAAKRELLETIAALPADARFTVVAFAHEARALGPTLQAATPESKAAAAEWIGKVATAPKTVAAVSEGIAKALEVAAASEEAPGRSAKLDTVVLFVAGRPMQPDGKPEPADMLRRIVEIRNKPVHALIEAIAFAEPQVRARGDFKWLEELAAECAGRIVWR
jgi:hypothetical protein